MRIEEAEDSLTITLRYQHSSTAVVLDNGFGITENTL